MTTKVESTCSHPDAFTSIQYIVYNPSLEQLYSKQATEDWDFATHHLRRPIKEEFNAPGWHDALEEALKVTSIRLCLACYNHLPSRVLDTTLQRSREEVLVQQSERQEVKERVEAGETIYLCGECNEFKEEDELVQVRECPHCEETFDGLENGRNCPSCNRPFTRLIAENGCPDCLSESTPELVTLELLTQLET